MENLPVDLKREILVRSPIKSLACLKCVSKSWLSIISDPYFAKLHYQQSSQHTHRFPYTARGDDDDDSHLQMRSIDINASLHDDDDYGTTLKFDFPLDYNLATILGSCRGFLLLLHQKKDKLRLRNPPGDKLLLWNPSTGERKQILIPHTHIDFVMYGFCYNESTDDYIIVLAARNKQDGLVLDFQVFSVRTNSWTEFGFRFPANIRIAACLQEHGPAVKGVIYWLVYFFGVDEPGHEPKIVSLDVKTNNVRQVPKPHDIPLALSIFRLQVFGESLALIQYAIMDNGKDELEVWVMKESCAWTKLVISMPCSEQLIDYRSPLCLTKDGLLVTLSYHNPHLQLSKWSQQGNLEQRRRYHGYLKNSDVAAATLYTETLLSLPSHT